MYFNDKDTIIRITPNWTGERFPDGRPKVSDNVLERLKKITFEEAWGPLWREGYHNNWECNFKTSADPRKTTLVGRAVTCVWMPARPDLNQALLDIGHNEEGRKGFFNQWVIDSLGDKDVVVVDLFDKIYQGTFVGGNLSTAIRNRTNTGGAVIWGGVRDLEQIIDIDGLQMYYRGEDPTAIFDCTMVGYNTPCKVGNAVCLPGDVVLGTYSGVIFIPAHMAEKVAVDAEKSHIRDVFGFDRLASKTYTTAQIDTQWSSAIFEDFLNWFKTDPRAAEFQHLTWDEELEMAKKRDEDEAARSEVRL